MQAEHVFIVGVNAGDFPADNAAVTEAEACQLLVALTRAKQSCTLVSTDRLGQNQLGQGVFINWLGNLVETTRVNASCLLQGGMSEP